MHKNVLDWQTSSRDDWKGRGSWHIDAINSSGFVDIKRDVKTEPLPSRIEKIIQKNMVAHNSMCKQLSQQKLLEVEIGEYLNLQGVSYLKKQTYNIRDQCLYYSILLWLRD